MTASNMILCEALRRRVRHIHFIGIGGIGMSGMAELLCRTGYHVSGSDLGSNQNTERLQRLGAVIHSGPHRSEHIDGADIVVHSSAVNEHNPEYKEAVSRSIPVVRRAEMLAELMRFKHSVAVAGSHGKTTTTSMIAALFEHADMDPTTINGGIINSHGTNARLGSGDWIIAEADESDGTFLNLPATVGVVTNIDPEHLDHYGDFDTLKEAFISFVKQLPFYGFAVICADHDNTRELAASVVSKKIITYGFADDADIKAENLHIKNGITHFTVTERNPMDHSYSVIIEDAVCNSPGNHNVQNSLAAVAIGRQLQLHEDVISGGLRAFNGVKRRFSRLGHTAKGALVVDDYAHHPVEVTVTLQAARDVVGDSRNIIAIFEPHRYSRVRDLFDAFSHCFKQADIVIVKEIHPAGEAPIEGIGRAELIASIAASGDSAPAQVLHHISDDQAIMEEVNAHASDGDIILCMGAGPITYFAAELYQQLSEEGAALSA